MWILISIYAVDRDSEPCVFPWWLRRLRICLQCGRPRFDPLEKGMATHSTILGWRIPWTEEPGGVQSMGSQESDMTERVHMSMS